MTTRRRQSAKGQLDLFEPQQADLFAPVPRRLPQPPVRSTPLEQELLARALDRVAKEEEDPIEAALLEASAQRLRGRKLH